MVITHHDKFLETSSVQWFHRNGRFFDVLLLFIQEFYFILVNLVDFSSIFATVSSMWKQTFAGVNALELLCILLNMVQSIALDGNK